MISLNEQDLAIAPCLAEGSIADSARSAVLAARALGHSRWASLARTWSVPYLFEGMERIFASGEEPIAAMNQLLDRLAEFLQTAARTGFAVLGTAADVLANQPASFQDPVEQRTGEHYGRLFEKFSGTSFWDEPVRLLRLRLERNDISLTEIQGKRVLDDGCGGGRYTVAWRLLGAGQVVGFDVSAVGLADARLRVQQAGLDRVDFHQGNVLQLPYADNAFQIVFSNGVLHHTADWQQGIAELVRVLQPGGLGWLYLIENPGGLSWDVIEILRVITHDERPDVARAALQLLGLPANRIFYMLDHVMVPINVRLKPAEIEASLTSAGATSIRRLARGTDFDRIEQIYRGAPFAQIKYGVGENRYVFTKS